MSILDKRIEELTKLGTGDNESKIPVTDPNVLDADGYETTKYIEVQDLLVSAGADISTITAIVDNTFLSDNTATHKYITLDAAVAGEDENAIIKLMDNQTHAVTGDLELKEGQRIFGNSGSGVGTILDVSGTIVMESNSQIDINVIACKQLKRVSNCIFSKFKTAVLIPNDGDVSTLSLIELNDGVGTATSNEIYISYLYVGSSGGLGASDITTIYWESIVKSLGTVTNENLHISNITEGDDTWNTATYTNIEWDLNVIKFVNIRNSYIKIENLPTSVTKSNIFFSLNVTTAYFLEGTTFIDSELYFDFDLEWDDSLSTVLFKPFYVSSTATGNKFDLKVSQTRGAGQKTQQKSVSFEGIRKSDLRLDLTCTTTVPLTSFLVEAYDSNATVIMPARCTDLQLNSDGVDFTLVTTDYAEGTFKTYGDSSIFNNMNDSVSKSYIPAVIYGFYHMFNNMNFGTINFSGAENNILIGCEVNSTITDSGTGNVYYENFNYGSTSDLQALGGGASALNDLSDVTITGVAQGNVLYRNASGWVNLAPGTSGKVLQTNGAAANPSWETVSGGAAALNDLTDVTITAAARGQILYRNATGWVNLAPGTAGKILQTNGAGADPTWVDAPTSTLTTAAKTTTYTLTNSDDVILADASSAGFTITLHAAASATSKVYRIKKTDSTSNTVIIDGNSSETIDGQLTYTLTAEGESVTIVTNGSNWFIV